MALPTEFISVKLQRHRDYFCMEEIKALRYRTLLRLSSIGKIISNNVPWAKNHKPYYENMFNHHLM